METFDNIPQNSEDSEMIVSDDQSTPAVIGAYNATPKVNYNKIQRQASVQENKQDLDQTQEVDVKPSQINVQRLEVMINNKIENYSGKITGVVYRSTTHEMVSNVGIRVYFGSSTEYPVYKTSSDENGNFLIPDLPPGYYTLELLYQEIHKGKVINIKVLPGETSYQPILLDKITTESPAEKYDKHFPWDRK